MFPFPLNDLIDIFPKHEYQSVNIVSFPIFFFYIFHSQSLHRCQGWRRVNKWENSHRFSLKIPDVSFVHDVQRSRAEAISTYFTSNLETFQNMFSENDLK